MNVKFAVFKLDDVSKYCGERGFEQLRDVGCTIEAGRGAEGRSIYNRYLIINRDEPYVDEVIEIMKHHGHWDGDTNV